ncbi:MAG: Acetyltransferase (GNAT) family protein [candidate division BRC1 bacterium ADurb.BinA364]|nr:MAG: Acetyltransferase (GNAT) family protein [candidate division BRC1 bacterium ADurb.BinA364]
MHIRIASESDAEAIAAIVRESFADQARALGMDPAVNPGFFWFEDGERVLRDMAEGAHAALGFIDGEPAGTVRWTRRRDSSDEGHIRRLAILPRFRGAGRGDSLMAFAEARMREAGMRIASLGIIAQFGKLQEYYERLGYRFRERKTFDDFAFECIIMAKSLEAQSPTGACACAPASLERR